MIYILLLILSTFSLPGNAQNEKFQDDALNFINLFDSNLKPGVSCYWIPSLITASNGNLNVFVRIPLEYLTEGKDKYTISQK